MESSLSHAKGLFPEVLSRRPPADGASTEFVIALLGAVVALEVVRGGCSVGAIRWKAAGGREGSGHTRAKVKEHFSN